MTEATATAPHADSAGDHAPAPYLKVFVYLLLLTVAEYFYAMAASRFGIPFPLLVLGLVVMALTKAVLVAMYFMHLKYEGRWVYLMVVPACLMAVILVVALVPDIGMHEPDGPSVAEIPAAPSRPS